MRTEYATQSLTVSDFARAAGVRAVAPVKAAKPADVFATGESHPEEDEAVDERSPASQQEAAANQADAAAGASAARALGAGEEDSVASGAGSVVASVVNDAPHDVAPLARTPNEEMADEAIAPRLPGLYGRDGRMMMPAPLKGSHEILVHQNEMADAAGLQRIRNDADLDRLRLHHELVGFSENAGLRVNPELPEDRRCARPWTVKFAQDTARAFYGEFHEALTVTSAVRTMAYQRRLQRVNGNAAAIDGDAASPHLTGQALDFGKRGMSVEEIAWMRAYLLPMMQAGKVDVEEEFQQACFHISVYRSYAPVKAALKTEVAALR